MSSNAVRLTLILALLALLGAGCAGDGSATRPTAPLGTSPSSSLPGDEGAVYVALGDSWPEGAHCDGCRPFPQIHAEALEKTLGEPVTFVNLAGQAQPSFDTPGKGGSAGLLDALRSDEWFREMVASGDIIVIATGANDGGEVYERIVNGTCGGQHDAACVAPLARKWMREFDAILNEVEALRNGHPTAIRLVNAANAFAEPSSSAETLRGFEAYFEALTAAICENAAAHDAVCVDVRPVLNGASFKQPVNDSSPRSMNAVAELLVATGVPELV